MTSFDYRTFLLPQLLVKLGVFKGVRSPNIDYRGNNFMESDIAPANVDQVVNFVHQTAILLNLAGYQLEAVTLAAIALDADGDGIHEGDSDLGISSGVFINFVKGEYAIGSGDPSDAENALEYLIQRDFLPNKDLCLALRITPRSMYWGASANEAYFTMPVALTGLGFSHNALDTTHAMWLLLGGQLSNTGNVVLIQNVMVGLENSITDLNEAIAGALAKEWATVAPNNRKGLLKYLNAALWGAMITGDTILGEEEELETHNWVLINMGLDVYTYLEDLSEVDFKAWLLELQKGSFKETLKQAKAGNYDSNVIPEIKTAIETLFYGTHTQRDWIKYKHVRGLIEGLVTNGTTLHYVNVLMLLEEMSVIDMLGRIAQTNLPTVTLPFDITGFYEQIPTPGHPNFETDPFDYHTLQINQVGLYAQGHWQFREQPALCSDEFNGGRFIRFKHYRFCLDLLPGQDYGADQPQIFMQIYRWINPNFLSTEPYLKTPDQAEPEDYCNQLNAEIGTISITKQPIDDDFNASSVVYEVNLPDYNVELEITIGSETILLRRVYAQPYVPQPDLIEAPLVTRQSLVVAQRFPFHSYDKVRVMASADYLASKMAENFEAFETDSNLSNAQAQALLEIDHNFAEWMARYACVSSLTWEAIEGPQLEQVRTLIMQILAQRQIALSDVITDSLTVLSVFLRRPIHGGRMKYTRAIMGDSIPVRNLEIEEAVDDGTANHVYDWSDNGLGEEIQGWSIETMINYGVRKTVKVAEQIADLATQLEKNVIPLALDVSIFLLEIEKISPLGNPYPKWAPGELHTYFGFLFGIAATPPGFKGIYFEANSTQRMYAGVNWDPGDFTGPIFQLALNAGVVLDTYIGPWRVDVGGWIEYGLQSLPPVQLFARWMGVDPNDIRLGFTLSATLFLGNFLDLQLRVPILSRGLNWVDYSYGAAYILEVAWLQGGIIHLPEAIMGHDSNRQVLESVFTPIVPLSWRVMSHTGARTYNEIDEWELEESDKILLRNMVAEYLFLFRSRQTKLTIIGHASPIGTKPYNLWLSQKRAQAVYDYIRSLLTDEEYLILPQNTIVQGYGELYANVYGAAERDESWQTVMIYLNGELVVALGESLSESDAG